MDLNLTYLHFFAFTSMTCQLGALLNLNFKRLRVVSLLVNTMTKKILTKNSDNSQSM